MKVDKIPETRGLSHIVKLLRLSPDPIKTDERYWFADEIESHTRSDLCVPRSEYDKLKQHADMVNRALVHLRHNARASGAEMGLALDVSEEAIKKYAEYRKETE